MNFPALISRLESIEKANRPNGGEWSTEWNKCIGDLLEEMDRSHRGDELAVLIRAVRALWIERDA
jgi:hypothetical protein